MNRPIRFGIIGCSRIARRRFIPALLASAAAKLECIGSRTPAKANSYATEFGGIAYGNYADVISDPQVDAVYISTPPFLHAEWVFKAAEAGKHIICEKPAFPDYQTALKAVIFCRQAGVRLMENYSFIYHPQHALVRQIVSEGHIGQLSYLHAEFSYPLPPEGDIRLSSELGGGVFHDSAGYLIAASLFHSKSLPSSVFSSFRIDKEKMVDNACSVSIYFPSGLIAHGMASFGTHFRARYALTGERGRIEVLRAFATPSDSLVKIILETDEKEESIDVSEANQFQLLLENFCACLKGNYVKDFEEDLLRQHTIMDAVYSSHKEKKLIEISKTPVNFIREPAYALSCL